MMIQYNHLRADVDALLKHVNTAASTNDLAERNEALFRAALRLMRLEKEIARMSDVISQLADLSLALEQDDLASTP